MEVKLVCQRYTGNILRPGKLGNRDGENLNKNQVTQTYRSPLRPELEQSKYFSDAPAFAPADTVQFSRLAPA